MGLDNAHDAVSRLWEHYLYEWIANLRGYLAWEQTRRKGGAGETAVLVEAWAVHGIGRGAQALCPGPLAKQQSLAGGSPLGHAPAPGKKMSPGAGWAPLGCWLRCRR